MPTPRVINFRVAWLEIAPPMNTVFHEMDEAFWDRCYNGAELELEGIINHDRWWITPRNMTPADWSVLSFILGTDLIAWYDRWSAAGFDRSLFIYLDRPRVRPKPKYVRHYEITPLELPG